MIYNFELIRPLLKFDKPGNFYFIQIFKRRKDNPCLETDMRCVRDYYAYSIDDLNSQMDSIITDCEAHNARAYIRLNVRHIDKIALMTMRNLTDLLVSGNTRAARNSYSSACGEHHSDPDKKFLVDIDDLAEEGYIKSVIEDLFAKMPDGGKILAEIPTPNGKHLITTPFNISSFRQSCPNVDVHKDNPTLLYAP